MPLVNRCKLMLFIGATYLSITPLFAESPTPPFSGEVDKEQIAAALQLTQQAAAKYKFILDGAVLRAVEHGGAGRPNLLALG